MSILTTVMYDDVWFHVASFCDIKDRGRLHIAYKLEFRDWSDLCQHYFGVRKKGLMRKMVERDWRFLMNWTHIENNTLSLPNGRQQSCWSPWCSPEHLHLKPSYVMVQFDPSYNKDHCVFIQWVRRLAQARFLCRLVEPRHLLAHYKWKKKWHLPQGNTLNPMMLPIARFRVRVFMHGLPCPRIERGMLVLKIVEFGFK